ncbi:uncharacterized protein LOC105697696 [Orussus abietinus]|uniref:uncharacterized protein LOC105697696 n=1 Tax=Orussus abietinus TaxID=222816 RepID=UPI000626C212|nr:uncharacterized protein LOC105697696 [Orussus abietinus]
MLALIFRGVFILGVLSWYSTTVWKIIDGYFKDQFQKYLQDEYQKNPKMREDVESYASAGKEGPVSTTPPTATTEEPTRHILDALDEDTCPVNAAESCKEIGIPKSDSASGNELEEDAVPNEKGATSQSSASSTLKKEEGPEGNPEEKLPGDNVGKSKVHDRVISEGNVGGRKKRVFPPSSSVDEGKKKPKVRTITLTEADFEIAKRRRKIDYDFAEFDAEDGASIEPPEGILVSELPFKPKADIGDLERVTADEFCPLTLEEEATCGETTKWP